VGVGVGVGVGVDGYGGLLALDFSGGDGVLELVVAEVVVDVWRVFASWQSASAERNCLTAM
jgi:hypothetical protein